MLGYRFRYEKRSWTVGRRTAQHVEADTTGRAVVPWRQPGSITPVFALCRIAAESTHAGHPDAGLRVAASAPSWLSPSESGEVARVKSVLARRFCRLGRWRYRPVPPCACRGGSPGGRMAAQKGCV